MSDKAGFVFMCCCCGDERPEAEAKNDVQLNGPVCLHCQTRLKWSEAWLKKSGIDRPLMASDLNSQLKARLGME